jgi:hypothetical protein
MTDVCIECGEPLDEDDKEFWDNVEAVGKALDGVNVRDCLRILAIHAADSVGYLDIPDRPIALLDFIANVSAQIAHIDDDCGEPTGPLQ